MPEQELQTEVTPRSIEDIQKTYSSDVQRMRAKNARARISAGKRAERNQRQKDAIAKIPAEHRI